MKILGISSFSHDPAAVLVDENGVVAAIEEGKLPRTRESHGIPRKAIDFCLAKAGTRWKELDLISVASQPLQTWRRHSLFRLREMVRAPLSSSYYQIKALGELALGLNDLRIVRVLEGSPKSPVLQFDHALCHAASAFYASPFERALILILDEQGDGRCSLLAEGNGNRLRELHSICFPNSLAWVYSQVTELLGFRQHSGEHKTQWLSVTGEPVFLDLFLEIVRRSRENVWPRLNSRFFRRGFAGKVAFSTEFYRRIGIPETAREITGDVLRANVAASVQKACSTVVIELLEALRKQHG